MRNTNNEQWRLFDVSSVERNADKQSVDCAKNRSIFELLKMSRNRYLFLGKCIRKDYLLHLENTKFCSTSINGLNPIKQPISRILK